MNDWVLWLPHVNASLNGVTTLLLLWGWVLIKQPRTPRTEAAHRNVMLAAFGSSVVFLVCYLIYHYFAGSKKFPTSYGEPIRYAYLTLLLTHVVLAAAVPVLALGTIYHGLRNQRPQHIRWAKITFPIWLYVSVTGLIVYAMLYILFSEPAAVGMMDLPQRLQSISLVGVGNRS
jgi:putative membrane protein